MVVGICKILYHYPEADSLKAKRQRLNSLKDRLKRKFNIAIAEVDYNDFWQKSLLGIVSINSDKKMLDKIFSNIIFELEKDGNGFVNDYTIEFINIGEFYY